MRPSHILLFWLLLFPILTPSTDACATGSVTVLSLVRDQFDRFVNLQRRGPPKQFLMPYYTAYISALDAFITDRGYCPQSFGPCCLTQNEVDDFHAIHDRSLVDSRIAELLVIDPALFYLPVGVVSDPDMPAFTAAQQTEIDIIWAVTAEALEDNPNSYVSVWSVLPEGLNMLYDPRQPETCAEFQKYKTSATSEQLVTSVQLIHEVAAMALHGQMLGVSDDDAIQLLYHATAFIHNGIRCEGIQNEALIVPTTFLPFYLARMNQHIANAGETTDAIPAVPIEAVDENLADSLRILSSYKSWGRVEHLVFTLLSTEKKNIKENIFSAISTSLIVNYMLDNTPMTNAQRTKMDAILTGAKIGLLSYVSPWLGSTLVAVGSTLQIAYRQGIQCSTSLFYEHTSPPQSLSDCCAYLCLQTSLLQTLTPPLSQNDCCTHCNEGACEVEDNPSNPLSALEEVHLIPYYEEGSTVVNL